MCKYENSKIYMIKQINETGNGYIGATTKKYLSSKFASDAISYENFKDKKIKAYSNQKLFEFFNTHGIKNCNIILIEEFKCKNKDELNTKLIEIINKTTCINYKFENVDTSEPHVIRIRRQPINDENHLTCPCGGRCTVFNTKQHSLTIKHIKYLNDEKQKQLLTDNILIEIIDELKLIGDAIIEEQLMVEQVVEPVSEKLIEPVIVEPIIGEIIILDEPNIELIDEEELKHLENCKYRDYDLDIRSWKD